MAARKVNAISRKAIEQAASKIILPYRPKEAGRVAQTGYRVNVDGGIAAGKGAGKGSTLIQRLISVQPHHLDQ